MAGPYDTHTTADIIVQDLSQEIHGKVVLVTGVSPGTLGAFFLEQITEAEPKLLILASRNLSKVQITADTLNKINSATETRTLCIDLEAFKSIRKAAATVNSCLTCLESTFFVNNAAIMAREYGKTEHGTERQFATGHVGPFLFTNLIMDKILASTSPRIVSVSSHGHRLSAMRWPDIGFSDGKLYNGWRAYRQTKTANILMATALAMKLGPRGLTAVSLHPGVINTNIDSNLDWEANHTELRTYLEAIDQELGNREGFEEDLPWKSSERGVATHVYAAFDPSLKEHNGAYLQDCHIANPYTETIKPYAQDKVEADKLWKLSEELVGQKLTY